MNFHTAIKYWVNDVSGGRWVDTTAGRAMFNAIIPKEIGFQNDMKKKARWSWCSSPIANGSHRHGAFLDRLKDFGFRNATRGGISIGIEDSHPRGEGESSSGRDGARSASSAHQTGNITNGERYNKVIDTWTHANSDIADAMVSAMRKSNDGFNPVFMMSIQDYGSRDQIRQLPVCAA